jgi:hypothetical protein
LLPALAIAAAGGTPHSIEAAAKGLVGLLNIADDVDRPGVGDHVTKVQAVSALVVLVTDCGGGTAATATISAGVMVPLIRMMRHSPGACDTAPAAAADTASAAAAGNAPAAAAAAVQALHAILHAINAGEGDDSATADIVLSPTTAEDLVALIAAADAVDTVDTSRAALGVVATVARGGGAPCGANR